MAKLDYQFSPLYTMAYRDNKATHEFIANFEKQLDEIVIKV